MNSSHSLLTNLHSWYQSLFRSILPQRGKINPRVEDLYFPIVEKIQPYSLQIVQNVEQEEYKDETFLSERVLTVKIMKNILACAFLCIYKFICTLSTICAKVNHTL